MQFLSVSLKVYPAKQAEHSVSVQVMQPVAVQLSQVPLVGFGKVPELHWAGTAHTLQEEPS